jgi:hypothetical protein
VNLNENTTKIIRELAIQNSPKKFISGEEVVLIRAYNEDKVLENVINELLNNYYKNILVVNDGSTDKTENILKNFSEKIYFVNHMTNR